MSELKKRVEASAGFYAKSFLNFDYKLADYNFRSLKPYFKGQLALELGPSSGYMTRLLVEEFRELHVVEGSKSLLDQIPDYPNVIKHYSLFEDFQTVLKFDTIIMSHVLEHINEPASVLKKIATWLDPTGVFLVSVPNAKSIHRMVAVQMNLLTHEHELNSRDLQLGHYRVYDTESLADILVSCGFTILETGGVFLKPLSNSQIETSWTPEMLEGFYKVGRYFPEHCAEIFAICTRS